jgi:small subunit ribosomal protein S17
MPKRVEVGVVISDKAAKTRRVEIPRLVRHPKYGKYMRRRTICHVHDEQNQSHSGDLVEIVESRPRSKLKRWELIRVVEKGKMVDLAAMRAAVRGQADRPSEIEPVTTGQQTTAQQTTEPGPAE